jgi:hypothetical protein
MRRVSVFQNILDPTRFLDDMTDPEFAADWWAKFENGVRQWVEMKGAVLVTEWEWSVEPVSVPANPGRRIVGSCWARPGTQEAASRP